jgi:hypothetical protein
MDGVTDQEKAALGLCVRDSDELSEVQKVSGTMTV